MEKIRLGIVGYGNIGRGAEDAISFFSDMELAAVFTRRHPDRVEIKSDVEVVPFDKIMDYRDKVDVLLLCGGSAADLPEQTEGLVANFNTVDTFDTHAKIPEYFNKVNEAALKSGKTAIISAGWDPGIFSIIRMISDAVLPRGKDYTFWGKGISQGHSDALRHISGVKNAVQYTIPANSVIDAVRSGSAFEFTARQKHTRECFVVLEQGADLAKIENEIKNMPNYFADYDTTVHFISEEELHRAHSKMPHGGFVFRTGSTGGGENKHIIEFSLKLDSNPEFTSGVLAAYARAAYRLNKEGVYGAKTVFDVPISYLSQKSGEELRAGIL